MTNFEIILCCLLVPTGYILSYIAGKRDLLSLITNMIEEKAAELQQRKIKRQSYLRDTGDLLDKAYEQNYLSGLDFSVLMHRFLISEDGYVIDTGNYENVNAEVALRLAKRIEEHPNLWKIFMVA